MTCPPEPLLSIIMPCYNRAADVVRILRAYDRQAGSAPFELIAIDDASTDRTFEILSTYRPARYELVARRQEKNSGPARARNAGIPLARGRWIAFVGDDILPSDDFVAGHVEAHLRFSDPRVAILGKVAWGKNLPVNRLMEVIDGEGAQQFSYFYLRDGCNYDFRHLYTANISMKTDFLRRLSHLFDTDFPYPAFEDAELGYRLSNLGMRILYCAGITAEHYHYHTTWSFTRRQHICGLSSRILVRKHPELGKHPSFRAHLRRFAVLCKPRHLAQGIQIGRKVDALEQAVLHMASTFEWSLVPGLAKLYSPLLDYAYYNGVMEYWLGTGMYHRWVHAAHADAFLFPAVRQFENHLTEKGYPYPAWMQKFNR